jgi:hypothetical protein
MIFLACSATETSFVAEVAMSIVHRIYKNLIETSNVFFTGVFILLTNNTATPSSIANLLNDHHRSKKFL